MIECNAIKVNVMIPKKNVSKNTNRQTEYLNTVTS